MGSISAFERALVAPVLLAAACAAPAAPREAGVVVVAEAPAPTASARPLPASSAASSAPARDPAFPEPRVRRPRRPEVFEGTGVLVAPKPIAARCAPPRYPEEARLSGARGALVVRAVVGADGIVTEASIEESSGNALLDAAALDAVFAWVFTPATWCGRPVELEALLPLRFDLRAPRR